MAPLNIGMIGVGNFGAARRILLRQTGLFRIVTVYDRDADHLAHACEQESADASPDAEALLSDPRIEAVVISTGATTHADLATQAMRHGKHVFVEKPLCCSAEEACHLRAVQRETGRIVGVGPNQNDSDPFVVLARQMIEQGKLGEVAAYEKNTSHSGGFQIKANDWRGRPEHNPGGMLFQCGVHAVHALTGLFGPVEQVQAAFRYDVNLQTRTADVAAVTLRHASGMLGTLNCYHVTAYCHELRLFGTKGNLFMDTFEHRAWYQKALYGPREPREETALPTIENADTANLRSWHRAVREGAKANPDLEDGIAAVLPIFAAERAAREQRAVRLDELATPTPVTTPARTRRGRAPAWPVGRIVVPPGTATRRLPPAPAT